MTVGQLQISEFSANQPICCRSMPLSFLFLRYVTWHIFTANIFICRGIRPMTQSINVRRKRDFITMVEWLRASFISSIVADLDRLASNPFPCGAIVCRQRASVIDDWCFRKSHNDVEQRSIRENELLNRMLTIIQSNDISNSLPVDLPKSK